MVNLCAPQPTALPWDLRPYLLPWCGHASGFIRTCYAPGLKMKLRGWASITGCTAPCLREDTLTWLSGFVEVVSYCGKGRTTFLRSSCLCVGAHWCKHPKKSDPWNSGHSLEPGLGERVFSMAVLLMFYSWSQAEKFRVLAACRLLFSVQFNRVRLFVTPWTAASSLCQVIISFSVQGGWVGNAHF